MSPDSPSTVPLQIALICNLTIAGADVDPIIWATVENAIGIVSVSLPTMRPIYSLLVHGHYCNSTERYCERCNKSRVTPSGGSVGERRVQKPVSPKSWCDTPETSGREGSYQSDNAILEKGGMVGTQTMEMY